MKPRLNTNHPLFVKDIFQLIALRLNAQELARLKSTCFKANERSKSFEAEVINNPESLVGLLSRSSKVQVSAFMQDFYRAASPHFVQLKRYVRENTEDHYAYACFAMAAPIAELAVERLEKVYLFLLAENFSVESCLMQSLALQLELRKDGYIRYWRHQAGSSNYHDYESCSFPYRNAYFNLQGAYDPFSSRLMLLDDPNGYNYKAGLQLVCANMQSVNMRDTVFATAVFVDSSYYDSYLEARRRMSQQAAGSVLNAENETGIEELASSLQIYKQYKDARDKARVVIPTDLTRANFSHADLSHTIFHDVISMMADYSFSNLAGSKLTPDMERENAWQNFAKTRFVSADLSSVICEQISFFGSDFSHSKLFFATLKKCDFVAVNLFRANLAVSALEGVDFSHANLEGADLSRSVGKHVTFNMANLRYADFSNANMCGLIEVTQFVGASLYGAIVTGADFTGANFRGADLRCKDLRKAKLQGAIYNNATLFPLLFSPEKHGMVGVDASLDTPADKCVVM